MNRRRKIKNIVMDFFLRHPETFFTHEEFHWALLGLPSETVKELKHTPHRFRRQKVQSNRQQVVTNQNKDLLDRWEELRPSDTEERVVWSELVSGYEGFTGKTSIDTCEIYAIEPTTQFLHRCLNKKMPASLGPEDAEHHNKWKFKYRSEARSLTGKEYEW